VIAFSFLFSVTLLIASFEKPKTITSKVDFIVFTKALNIAFSAFCSYLAFLALTLLNIRTKAPLKSFLAPVIKSLPSS
jgi:hypothetical protein